MNPKILQLIQALACKLASRYRFSYHTIEDIEQEAIIIGLEGLSRYNKEMGALSTFLYHHINNRLKNFKRNHTHYLTQTCPICNSKTPSKDCEVCQYNETKRLARKNILEPISLDSVDDENERNMWTELDLIQYLESKEIFSIIESYLPVDLRADYLRLRDGALVPYGRKLKLIEFIQTILEEHGHECKHTYKD